jgi:UDP-glucose 4-epimerase
MRAIVTGGAGFIGSHVVDELVANGDRVLVVDNMSRGWMPNLADALSRGARLVRADVTDIEAMTRTFDDFRPDVVYHLAAQIDVRLSLLDPTADARANLGGTAAILEAAHLAGARRIVLASTAGVYGDPEQLPIPEDTATAPLSPYGASKGAAESYLALYRRLYGLSTVCLRMANVYGPRQDPHGEAGVVAIFCDAAAEGRVATIFGDGTQTRDYVYVSDVARAFAAAGACSAEGAINVATGLETSIVELAAALGLQTVHAPERAGEIERSVLDPSRARRELDWEAQVPLARGLSRTLAHLSDSAATDHQRAGDVTVDVDGERSRLITG